MFDVRVFIREFNTHAHTGSKLTPAKQQQQNFYKYDYSGKQSQQQQQQQQ